jgi:membrane protease YdiL (CAAX protease family)
MEMPETRAQTRDPGALIAWLALAGALALVSYSARAAAGDADDSRDLLYRYSFAIGGLVQYGIVLAILAVIARRIPRRTLGFVAPVSWRRAGGLIVAAIVSAWLLGSVLGTFLKAGEEQGLTPDGWEPSHAGAFFANVVVIVLVAPFVEELMYRGVGFVTLQRAWGTVTAVLGSALLFGLGHGLIVALPMLALLGVILALLRARTGSLYPPMITHALFNGAALAAAVTIGGSA